MPDTDLLRDLINALDKKLTGRLDELLVQAKITNGRVTIIETERTAEKAVLADISERKVRREDYKRGPLTQHLLAGVIALIALAALIVPFFH